MRANPSERLEISFKVIPHMHRLFDEYWFNNAPESFKQMTKRSLKQMARRKAFIEWYVNENQTQYLTDSIAHLSKMLFISENRIYNILKER